MRGLGMLVAAAVAIAGCSCGDDGGGEPDAGSRPDAGADARVGSDAGADAGTSRSTFDVWREVRTAMRASPDHLPARAEALVAAGDLDGLFALVRDDVRTLPGEES